jgi:hypothetical protein
LIQMGQPPCLEILLSLKYLFTLSFKALKNCKS